MLQYIWMLVLLLGMAALQIGMGPALLPSLRAAGAAVTLLAIGVAMGGAWALYYAAEHVDRVQARPREGLCRVLTRPATRGLRPINAELTFYLHHR